MRKPRNQKFNKDISGQRFGILTAKYPTSERERGSVVWVCECECGSVVQLSVSRLAKYKSCGCLRKKAMSEIHTKLDFFEGTCVQWLENRKHRCDNKSGFRGVFFNSNEGKWKASIGFMKKRYHLGTFDTYEEAVDARLKAEEDLYEPFLNDYHNTKSSGKHIKNDGVDVCVEEECS